VSERPNNQMAHFVTNRCHTPTKRDRSLEFTSVYKECVPGKRKIAVKVVDIFGNDTMTIVEVTIGTGKAKR
jgi:hypothetical protein